MCRINSAVPGRYARAEQPRPPLNKIPLLRKSQNKVQEQCRLQHPCNNVAPINNPVKVIEFPGVLKRIRDERDDAKNIEVCRTGRGPAAQQNVQTNSQINQRNEAEREIEGSVSRKKEDFGVQGNRIPDQRVRRVVPDARRVELPHQPRGILDFLAIYRDQLVIRFDSGLRALPVWIDAISDENAVVLNPPDAVIWHGGKPFLLKVKSSKDDGRHC